MKTIQLKVVLFHCIMAVNEKRGKAMFDITLITVEGGDHRLSSDGMPEAVVMTAMDFYLND